MLARNVARPTRDAADGGKSDEAAEQREDRLGRGVRTRVKVSLI